MLANPIVAAVLFAGSLWVFYYTPLFGWATTNHVGHQWMIVHFLVTGYLFVQSLIGIDPSPTRRRTRCGCSSCSARWRSTRSSGSR